MVTVGWMREGVGVVVGFEQGCWLLLMMRSFVTTDFSTIAETSIHDTWTRNSLTIASIPIFQLAFYDDQ